MGRAADERLTAGMAREVCQRTGSKAMMTGSITGLGSQYVIGLKAVNCNSGDVLAEAQEQAIGKEAVLKALLERQAEHSGKFSADYREKLGKDVAQPELATGGDPELGKDLSQVVLDSADRNSWAAICGLDKPDPARRAVISSAAKTGALGPA